MINKKITKKSHAHTFEHYQRVKVPSKELSVHLSSSRERRCRFYSLYDKVYRADNLNHAWRLVRSNRGSAGVDGVTFEDIEGNEGKDAFLAELEEALKSKTYKRLLTARLYNDFGLYKDPTTARWLTVHALR